MKRTMGEGEGEGSAGSDDSSSESSAEREEKSGSRRQSESPGSRSRSTRHHKEHRHHKKHHHKHHKHHHHHKERKEHKEHQPAKRPAREATPQTVTAGTGLIPVSQPKSAPAAPAISPVAVVEQRKAVTAVVSQGERETKSAVGKEEEARARREREQRELDREMLRRRERVEQWRREHQQQQAMQAQPTVQEKKWSLDRDEDDAEDPVAPAGGGGASSADASGPDPFEEYMVVNNQQAERDVAEIEAKIEAKIAQGASGGSALMEALEKQDEEPAAEDDEQVAAFLKALQDSEEVGVRSGSGRKKKSLYLLDVDHSKIKYQPFTKNLYVEVPEIARLTREEVLALRRDELDGCIVHGKGCPKPVKNWGQCGLSLEVMDVITQALKYEQPTPIQRQAIPAILSGRDVIGCAKTGSGKTLAFVLPMLSHIAEQPPLAPGDGPIALLVAPIRELAQQISSVARKFAKPAGIRVASVYGGAGIADQIGDLKRGAEAVVCTPGRMIDVLISNAGRITNLRRVTYVVLDEADRMFDMGFEPQVTKIVDCVRPDRQTVMFSATFPQVIEMAARRMLTNPLEIICGGRGVACKDVDQHVEVLQNDQQRFSRLLELLKESCDKAAQSIVFVSRQSSADKLYQELLGAGFSVLVLHSGVDQADRLCTLGEFKKAEKLVLVATSLASRGLDVKGVELVINYDVPSHLEEYVHRIGRTGRAGRKGTAWTFLLANQDERYAREVAKALRMSDQKVPPDLQKMVESFESLRREVRQKTGRDIKVSSGFSKGHGCKFDDAERKKVEEQRRIQRALHGEDDLEPPEKADDLGSDSEGEEKQYYDDDDRDVAPGTLAPGPPLPGTAHRVMPLLMDVAASQQIVPVQVVTLPSGEKMTLQPLSVVPVAPQPGTSSVPVLPAPITIVPGMTAEQIAAAQKAAAWALNVSAQQLKLKQQHRLATDRRHFEDELDLNDTPQSGRVKATSRPTLNEVTEVTGAAITVRGIFAPPGKVLPPGERKLHLLIEGPSPEAVQRAKVLLKKVIDSAASAGPASGKPSAGGRYNVLA